VALLGAVGRETVADLMGSAVLLLLRHPDQRAVLEERPAALIPAIEESLRCESPAQVIARVATRAGDLGGERLSPGDMVILLLGAANRDASRFRDPAEFDVLRRPNRHLAFGAGPHRCPGASLGRAQARVALAGFLRRFPAFSGGPAAPNWKPTVVHRGLSNLPIHL
jgi:cytochrome P450